jgi:uncharacterized membrane protein YozB (DUF420 family)
MSIHSISIINQDFFEYMNFITNVLTGITLLISLLFIIIGRKNQSKFFRIVHIAFCFLMLIIGLFLFQPEVNHKIGGVIVFIFMAFGVYQSFQKSTN